MRGGLPRGWLGGNGAVQLTVIAGAGALSSPERAMYLAASRCVRTRGKKKLSVRA